MNQTETIAAKGHPMDATDRADHMRAVRQSGKGTKRPAEPLTPEEVEAILAAISPRYPTGQRNRAALVLMWRCGLRVSECLDLQPRDVDLKRGTVRIRNGKGRKSRVVGLDPMAAEVIGRWLDTRRAILGRKRGPVICQISHGTEDKRGKPVSRQYLAGMLKRKAIAAGIDKRVHCHGLRHSMAVGMVESGKPVNLISRALGHSKTSVTSTYVDHIAPTEVIDAMRAMTWGDDTKTG